jgi:hypothetical protein
MGEIIYEYKVLVTKHEEKRERHRWEYIKMDLRVIRCDNVRN